MLQNSSSVLKGWAAFALLQFTVPGGRNSQHISSFLQRAGAPRVLCRTVAATTTSPQAKILAQIVLRNLEHHQTDCATQPGLCFVVTVSVVAFKYLISNFFCAL